MTKAIYECINMTKAFYIGGSKLYWKNKQETVEEAPDSSALKGRCTRTKSCHHESLFLNHKSRICNIACSQKKY